MTNLTSVNIRHVKQSNFWTHPKIYTNGLHSKYGWPANRCLVDVVKMLRPTARNEGQYDGGCGCWLKLSEAKENKNVWLVCSWRYGLSLKSWSQMGQSIGPWRSALTCGESAGRDPRIVRKRTRKSSFGDGNDQNVQLGGSALSRYGTNPALLHTFR